MNCQKFEREKLTSSRLCYQIVWDVLQSTKVTALNHCFPSLIWILDEDEVKAEDLLLFEATLDCICKVARSYGPQFMPYFGLLDTIATYIVLFVSRSHSHKIHTHTHTLSF
jgi:hypothetical protein